MTLDHYKSKLARLRADSKPYWPDSTFHCAPYKPMLLLSIMITLDLRQRKISLDEILDAADQDTVVIVRSDGKRLILEQEDAFEHEATTLGQSEKFMAFLTARSQEQGGIALEAFERRLEAEERRGEKEQLPSDS